MPDMQKLMQIKDKILEIIKQRGPELPVKVASTIGQNNIFTAAFMSELVGEQKLKISNMKVGGSPLYYIPGQEEQLQKFTEYLNHKEREAFKILKEKEILSDDEQEPAIRVALRSIKDFAFPIKIIDKGIEKIFWKIHTISNDKAKEFIEQKINPKPEIKEKIEEAKEVPQIKDVMETKITETEDNQQIELKKEENLNIFDKPIQKKQKVKEVSSNFLDNLKSQIKERDYEILKEILVKKKEFVAKIRMDTNLGKQEIYLVAKDKKKITLDDIVNTLQKAQVEKMPALIISNGDIDKKALDYYKEWSNLVKHQKLKL
jgi:hypothetical protein